MYVVALQRTQEDTTTWEHVKALNQVVDFAQQNPVHTHYRYLGERTRFIVFSDAAFKKEESTGHALKGTVIVRVAVDAGQSCLPSTGNQVACHVIDYLTKRVRNVTRSTV